MIAFKKWTGMFNGRSSESYQTVQVRAPRDYFNRADAFIEDVKYMTEEELTGLNKAFLAKLLFDNFLESVRQGKDLYEYLSSLSRLYGSVLTTPNNIGKKVSDSSAPTKFHWSLTTKNGKKEESEFLTLSIRLHSKEVNRVNVFFEDLRWKHHPLDIELDELVSLLFIEFITALRNGLTEETSQEIMDFILSKWEER
ncbi:MULTISPECIES: hypothetical protein [Paenibacillus]|uniref:Uncharacterized protein n=1 Tax=Paenibacillus radicis (ex Xue et al. 2023) TaxID=2972489 RepID=A0ABT1YPS6_9BACL|nr:hypothetical protein [Paenibacillus radicis (ex Xue et al. 2023)]MCR8635186.1 hypothetical protein [Paenibacillus radicis (ex Xue et al. 2023)]